MPPDNFRVARLLWRRQRHTRSNLRARSTRYIDNWLDHRIRMSVSPDNWRPSALVLYQLPQNQLDSSSDLSSISRASYLPLYIEPSRQTNNRKASPFIKPLDMSQRMLQRDTGSQASLRQSSYQWPQGRMPVELFEQITDYLSRDDIKSMRLVNREFEYGVSSVLFRTAVVPFNTEIYDMIERQTTARPNPKGKGKERDLEVALHAGSEDVRGMLHWENRHEDTENKVYKGHGLRVFSGFGPRILKYGMSFEVEEDVLSSPPQKLLLEPQVSFWGGYEWPHEQYRRFADRAGLEQAADETSKMKQAFSHLHKVQQLALSVDSGLGWLRGPDVSIRSRVFKRPPSVFGDPGRIPDKVEQEQENLWQALQVSNRFSGMTNKSLKTSTLCKKDVAKPLEELPTIGNSLYANIDSWPLMEDRIITNAGTESMYHNTAANDTTPSSLGVLYAQPDGDWENDEIFSFKHYPLNPSKLSKEQKEWLLETEWAQRAFMMSYMLAIVDNPIVFARVHTLNLSRISSRYVSLLDRADFWTALPQLTNVIIKVIPDWRNCCKDNAGFVETPWMEPTEALEPFNKLLIDQIREMRSIVSLTLGWINGGEEGEGIYARNQHLLPAPILCSHHPISAQKDNVMTFPYIEHLTISNCWITPPAIVAFVEQSCDYALAKLTFDSVSLTAHPKFPSALNALANVQLAGQQNGQAQGQNQGQILLPGAHYGHLVALDAQQAHFLAQFQAQLQQGQHLPYPPMNQNQNVPPALALQQGLLQLIQHHQPAPVQNQQQQPLPAALHPLAHQPPAQGHHHPAANPNSQWGSCREGSWPDVINQISPGRRFLNLSDLSTPSRPLLDPDDPDDPDAWNAASARGALHTLEFRSCGYCRLASSTFDQAVLDVPLLNIRPRDPYFHKRANALASFMMASKDRLLGSIVQYMPEHELNVLLLGWGMRHGWMDRQKAEEAEYDGFLPGGTGRFSGVVNSDALVSGNKMETWT